MSNTRKLRPVRVEPYSGEVLIVSIGEPPSDSFGDPPPGMIDTQTPAGCTETPRPVLLAHAVKARCPHCGKRPGLLWLAEPGGTWRMATVHDPACPESVQRRGESSYERDYRISGAMMKLTASHPGCTLLINHHVRKEKAEDYIDTLSGTAGITGSPDTVLVLVRKHDEKGGVLYVTGRDIEEDTYQLTGFPRWVFDGADLAEAAGKAETATAREHLGDRSIQILDTIESRGGMSTAEVAGMLGMTTDTASVYLGRLAKTGKIHKHGRGKWVPRIPPVVSVGSVGVSPIPTEQTGDMSNTTAYETAWWSLWRMADHVGATAG